MAKITKIVVYENVKRFLKIEEPWCYDFKRENNRLKSISDPLERMLAFKKKGYVSGFDPDCSELTMSIMCALLDLNGLLDLDKLGNDGFGVIDGRHICLSGGEIVETDTAQLFHISL